MSRWKANLFLGDRPRFWARFGGRMRTVVSGSTSNSLGERPSAEFSVDATTQPFDYATEVQLGLTRPGRDLRPQFTGFVVRAETSDDTVKVAALGATEMSESTLTATVMWGVPPLEQMHMIARSAGVPDERIRIDGFPQDRLELFVVRIPVDGLSVVNRQRVGGVTFEDAASVSAVPPLADDFDSVESSEVKTVATALVMATTLWDAQELGIAMVSSALDLLLGASLYSWSSHPDGRLLDYSRDEHRARPVPRPIAHVSAYASGRGWVRETDENRVATAVDLERLVSNWPHLLGRRPSEALINAFRYLRASADPTLSLVERVQALWNAVELYVVGTEVEQVADKATMSRLRYAVKNCGLTPDQVRRATELLGSMNNPPLFRKLIRQAEVDGLPLEEEDRGILRRTRNSRNDIAHGRIGESESLEDLTASLAIVTRLLMRRWYLESTEPT